MTITNAALCGLGAGLGCLLLKQTYGSSSSEESKKTDQPDLTDPITTIFFRSSLFSFVPKNTLVQRALSRLSTVPVLTGFIFTSDIKIYAHKIPGLEKEADRIHNFVILHKEILCKKAQKDCSDIYIRPSESGLSRALQFTQTGRVIIHLNRKKLGDQLLGKGGYKKVTKAVDLESLQFFASASFKNFEDKESDILMTFKGIPGFVQICHIATYESQETNYLFVSKFGTGKEKKRILLEFYNKGDLLENITLPKKITFAEKKQILEDLVNTVKILHEKGYLHRDIKPENIFLSQVAEPKTSHAALGDFGFTCKETDENETRKATGSSCYLSPEYAITILSICREEPLDLTPLGSVTTKAHDIWSLGLTLAIMLGFFIPSWGKEDLSKLEILDKITKYEELPEPTKHSPEHLAWSMIRKDPSKRISAKTAAEELVHLNWPQD